MPVSPVQAARYCGRSFSALDLETIRSLIEENPSATRAALSRLVCERLGWVRQNGGLKDMSCRVAMLRMQDDGLIELPSPRHRDSNQTRLRRRTQRGEPPAAPLELPAGKLRNLCLSPVASRQDSALWNELIDRYHYLGYHPLPGAQIRYLARGEEQVVAALGFGAAAWKTAPRDRFIGWTPAERERRLHLVVGNARFLILPWVRSRNLASRLLGMASRRLRADFEERYGYRPALIETFVETPRFRGTCYQAANWTYLGKTQGRGKLDTTRTARLARKAIWVLPLVKGFRKELRGS